MYHGVIKEHAPTRTLFANPQEDYTRRLLSAIPSLDPDHKLTVQRATAD
ncbi:MAG: hypothetical protein AAFP67_06170 [Pseudomonadota bacterium]